MQILKFIQERFPQDNNWTNGNCYFFAIILKTAFPSGEIIYNPIEGHFMFLYKNEFYDWEGKQQEPKVWYNWKDEKINDPLHWSHIMRDCVSGEFA